MARKERTGNRKTREQRKQFKVPELGYYLIVTDTEATERCFFTGLHQALPEDVRNKLVIKVVETKTRIWIGETVNITNFTKNHSTIDISDTRNGHDDRIVVFHNVCHLSFNLF